MSAIAPQYVFGSGKEADSGRVEENGLDFKTALPESRITELRRPFVTYQGSPLQHPGTARANIAASQEKPDGTTEDGYARQHAHQTVSYRLVWV